MIKLHLIKPLLFFDFETTGLDVKKDRIVSMGYLILEPNGSFKSGYGLFNPTIPISDGAKAVHGITDERVSNEPTFEKLVRPLYSLFSGCDLAGFNIYKFDLPMLIEEFKRCGIQDFPAPNTCIIDVMHIYHMHVTRTLTDAFEYYTGNRLEGAHNALTDIKATFEIFKCQLEKHPGLPTDVESISTYCKDKKRFDSAGKFSYDNSNELRFTFGRYNDQRVKEIMIKDYDYIEWVMREDSFQLETRWRLMKFVDENRTNGKK